MQLLVFIVIIAIYAIGALIKSQASKLEQKEQEKEQEPPQTPAKASQRASALKKYLRSAAEQASKTQPVKQRPEKKLSQRPREPEFKKPKKIPAFTSGMDKKTTLGKPIDMNQMLVDKSETAAVKPLEETELTGQQQGLTDELIGDYMQKEYLRKAILHYEILGKPLSIRRSSNDIF